MCGDIGCCYTPWQQGSFTEGGCDFFERQIIGECGNFPILSNTALPYFGKIIEEM